MNATTTLTQGGGHELSKAECPNCPNLHLPDGRLNAGPPSLHLVGRDQSLPQDHLGVIP